MISLFPLSAFTLHRNPFFLFVVRMLKLNNKYDWQLQFYSIQTMYTLHSLGGKLCRIFSFEFMSVCYGMRVKIPIIRWRWKLHIYTHLQSTILIGPIDRCGWMESSSSVPNFKSPINHQRQCTIFSHRCRCNFYIIYVRIVDGHLSEDNNYQHLPHNIVNSLYAIATRQFYFIYNINFVIANVVYFPCANRIGKPHQVKEWERIKKKSKERNKKICWADGIVQTNFPSLTQIYIEYRWRSMPTSPSPYLFIALLYIYI